MPDQPEIKPYRPVTWEKIVGYGVAVWVVVFASFLLWRNQPFADPNLVVALRTLLSLSVAIIGAIIPGFLNVDLRVKGTSIRAGSALALFLLTYMYSPTVIPSLKLPEVLAPNLYPSDAIIDIWPTDDELDSPPSRKPENVTFRYKNAAGVELELFVYDFCKKHRPPPNMLGTPVFWQPWLFPADGKYRKASDFKLSNGWFGFAIGRLRPDGQSLSFNYMTTKNIFYSDAPTLTITRDLESMSGFAASFGELDNEHE